MVPIAPFTVFGEVSAVSKGTAAGAFLLGMLAMLISVCSYSEMSKASTSAGSTYSFIRIGFGRYIGFLGGWLIALDYILVPGLAAILIGTACRYVIPFLRIDVCVIAFVGVSTAINLSGIKRIAWVNQFVMALVMIALAAFFAAGFSKLSGGGLTIRPLLHAETFSSWTIFQSVSIATLCFLGFDSVSTFSGRNKVKNSKCRLRNGSCGSAYWDIIHCSSLGCGGPVT